jgi:ADP-ribosylglycohydrolase
MLGAIAGDMAGSLFEGRRDPPRDFPLLMPQAHFTDDTVLTVAVASAILEGGDFARSLRAWGRRYPRAGYGRHFSVWLREDAAGPYGSFGNGAAMRVSPVAWACQTLEEVLAQARRSAEVTHDHPEGIRGAQAVAAAVFAARTGQGRAQIRALLEQRFGYDCAADLARLRRLGGFDVSCQGTVPVAAAAFLHSNSFEDTLRNAVSIGGDTDTLACIAGAIAEGFYGGVPRGIRREVLRRLDAPLMSVLQAFAERFALTL